MRTTLARTARVSAGAAAFALAATVLGGTGAAFAQEPLPVDPGPVVTVDQPLTNPDYGQILQDTLRGAAAGFGVGVTVTGDPATGTAAGAVGGLGNSVLNGANYDQVLPPTVPAENSPTPPGGVTSDVINGALNPQ